MKKCNLIAGAAIGAIGIAIAYNLYSMNFECQEWASRLRNIDNIRVDLLNEWEKECWQLDLTLSEKLQLNLPGGIPTTIQETCDKILQKSIETMHNFKNITQLVPSNCRMFNMD